jgi:dihydrofolate synthase/folylpolyglutamate synthase
MNLNAWLTRLEQRHPKSIELGLERCGNVYQQLGSPRPAKKIFTVAGTNGKGSTVAYLAAMSGALGQRFGTYTSPHIFRFNERVCIMGEPVSDEVLVRAFEKVESARGEISLTYFEFTTLAGFLILQQAGLDCAILEVGLGGRLDTVNLVDADCTIITPIGLDHQDFLGPDLNSIAREKAGIIRSGTPLVCTETDPPPPVLEAAKSLEAPVYRRAIEFDLTEVSGVASNILQFSLGDRVIDVPRPSMGGKHQLDNLAAALTGLFLLNSVCPENLDDIAKAIKDCSVPGRLQHVSSSPDIFLDVGHNELAAEAVSEFLESRVHSGVCCVLAMLADKSAEAVALALGKVCKRWLCADSYGERGQSGEHLAQRLRAVLPEMEIGAFESLDDAMEAAVSNKNSNLTILVFGSFTTAAGAAEWLRKSMQRDRHDAAKLTRGDF